MWKIYVFFCLLVVVSPRELPKNYKKCEFKPDDACWAAAIQKALHNLKNGVQEVSLPTAEPLRVPGITIGEGTGAVHVIQNYKNVKLHGITNSTIQKVDTSRLASGHLVAQTLTPLFYFKADYDFNGQILVIPMRGKGKCALKFHNLVTTHTIDFELVERKGVKYLKINSFNLNLNPERVEYDFENLFEGNKELGDNLNRVLNENSKEVFDDVRSGYESSIGEIFKNYANQFFKSYNFDDLFNKV